MNGRYIPEFPSDEIKKSIVHFMGKNPNGATFQSIVFEVQSDALLSGCMPPDEYAVKESIEYMTDYSEMESYIHVTPPQSDDWMYQRLLCDVVDRMRRVLIETISVCAHTAKPTLDGIDLVELLEALRVKEK